ncbi:hypothetical protein KPATCC21470_0145 [Kitasatospora purpeofusca]
MPGSPARSSALSVAGQAEEPVVTCGNGAVTADRPGPGDFHLPAVTLVSTLVVLAFLPGRRTCRPSGRLQPDACELLRTPGQAPPGVKT